MRVQLCVSTIFSKQQLNFCINHVCACAQQTNEAGVYVAIVVIDIETKITESYPSTIIESESFERFSRSDEARWEFKMKIDTQRPP